MCAAGAVGRRPAARQPDASGLRRPAPPYPRPGERSGRMEGGGNRHSTRLTRAGSFLTARTCTTGARPSARRWTSWSRRAGGLCRSRSRPQAGRGWATWCIFGPSGRVRQEGARGAATGAWGGARRAGPLALLGGMLHEMALLRAACNMVSIDNKCQRCHNVPCCAPPATR